MHACSFLDMNSVQEDLSAFKFNLCGLLCIYPNMSAHSMEEAENLCDRLGIFVDGDLQCVGNPKEVI